MFVEEFVEGVGDDSGFGGEDVGGGSGGCHPEHGVPAVVEVSDRRGEGGGLARPGRPHDQLEGGEPGYGPAGVDLSRTQPGDVDVPATSWLAAAGMRGLRSAHSRICSSWSRMAWVVRTRSTADSVIGRPSRRSGAPSEVRVVTGRHTGWR